MLAGVDGGSNAVTRVVALPGSGGTVNIASRRRCSMSDRFGGPFSKCGRAKIITLSASADESFNPPQADPRYHEEIDEDGCYLFNRNSHDHAASDP
jgi:hypothetical protein